VSWRRLPFLLPAGLALLLGVDAGLRLLGVPALPLSQRLPVVHGPLLVLGFVGTLVALERAVALRRPAGYAAPALLGAGGLLLVAPLPLRAGQSLSTAGHSDRPSSGWALGSSDPSNITCMPTQMPSTGRPPARRVSMRRGPPARRSPAMQAWKLPTPGTNRPSAASAACRSAVSSTSAPTCSRARTPERTLPLP